MGRTVRNHRDEARRRLASLLQANGPIDLVEAAFLVAAEEYPGLDVEREKQRLGTLGSEAASRVDGRENPFARLDALRVFLFEELGFQGNADQYDDPRNSYLNEVLSRRTGIPLTLSIVLIEVARRAGFEASGISLPGHFVARLSSDGRSLLVDPFHGRRIISAGPEDSRRIADSNHVFGALAPRAACPPPGTCGPSCGPCRLEAPPAQPRRLFFSSISFLTWASVVRTRNLPCFRRLQGTAYRMSPIEDGEV